MLSRKDKSTYIKNRCNFIYDSSLQFTLDNLKEGFLLNLTDFDQSCLYLLPEGGSHEGKMFSQSYL